MTQPSRTTESINRDNAAIRDIMHQIRELTVPDRATLALGLVGHLATMMNRRQMSKLMAELQDEAQRVQDVPPSRQREQPAESSSDAAGPSGGSGARPGAERAAGDLAPDPAAADPAGRAGESTSSSRGGGDMQAGSSIGQAGRGAFRSGELL